MNRRRLDFDLLRVLSMLGVIYLHVAATPLRELENTALWLFADVGAALAAPAVPLFFMISGALILREEKTTDLGCLFRRRLPRILVPLCAWSALILAYTFLTDPTAGWDALSHILSRPAAVPYWFLYALVPLYLLSPLLKAMTDHLSGSHWRYMIALWVLFTLGLHTLQDFLPKDVQYIFTEHWTLNLNMVGGYLGYFLLGPFLDRMERLPSRPLLGSVCVLSVVVIALGTRWDSYAQGTYATRFADYLNLFTLAYAVGLFLLCKSLLRRRGEPSPLLTRLSALSFPVYMMHPLVIGVTRLVWPLLPTLFAATTLPGHILFTLTVTAVCLLASFILVRIPLLRFLFAGVRG